ncbi:hypothetical protein [Corynebacterium antarcticum]|uniref:hypothetical protein n=1 Tax=Corynebacterium antarcticum TaxID=2800405 RepID=UPI0020052477|nr:hypothetical protein [Corynebacterium antarcticum]MCK7661970.1 hypothetical protein [Corynebacterium antarcticum]
MLGLEIAQHYIRDLTDLPVSSLVPPNRPDAFIRVDAGTPVRTSPVTDETLIIIQVYGPTLDDVLDEITTIREAMHIIDQIEPYALGWDERAGPHRWPDPDLPTVHRWQTTGTLIQALQ